MPTFLRRSRRAREQENRDSPWSMTTLPSASSSIVSRSTSTWSQRSVMSWYAISTSPNPHHIWSRTQYCWWALSLMYSLMSAAEAATAPRTTANAARASRLT